jgi:lipopolysaccharide transport system ATP-binding protein
MDILVSCNNVSKAYKIYEHQNDQLKDVIFGGFRKFYREKWVLKNIDLNIVKNQCVGLIGSNGAGKSTLLQIIAGITSPTCGDVTVKGSIAPILALGASFDDLLTGRQNAELGAVILGLSSYEARQQLPSIERFADIGDSFDYPLRVYSTGMKSRLAFAICAHVNADLLLVDEALAVGDENFAQKCNHFMLNKIKESTVLIVSHNLAYVEAVCNTVGWVERGELINYGSPKLVLHEYKKYVDLNHE